MFVILEVLLCSIIFGVLGYSNNALGKEIRTPIGLNGPNGRYFGSYYMSVGRIGKEKAAQMPQLHEFYVKNTKKEATIKRLCQLTGS